LAKSVRAQIEKLLRKIDYELLNSPALVKLLEAQKIDVVLDVGANIGQFGQKLREQGYRGRIVSFEPIKSVFDTLKSVAGADGHWEAYNYALGATPAQSPIRVSEATVYSSMLDQTSGAKQFDQSSKVVREEIVEIKRLDDIFASFKGHNIFLKIDTQGFEQEVLNGAQLSLKGILCVQMELPIVHLYQGVWSLPEALIYMSKRGFIVAQVRPINFENPEQVALLEIDCVFRRKFDVGD
jgi:FkbM family methyltransferase